MTAEEYRALLDVDFNNVKIEDLTDIRKIKIDKNQPQSKRQAQFLKQVGNPYMRSGAENYGCHRKGL